MDTASHKKMPWRSPNVEGHWLTLDLNALSAAKKSAADSDAIGVLLPRLPLSSMPGGNKEALLALAKGRLDAIESVQASRDCE